jgi:hypothetical protein
MNQPDNDSRSVKPVMTTLVAVSGAIYLIAKVAWVMETGDFLQPVLQTFVLLALLATLYLVVTYASARRFVLVAIAVFAFVAVDLTTTHVIPIQDRPSWVFVLTEYLPFLAVLTVATIAGRRLGLWP